MTTGSYHEVQGQPVVRFERTFPHPVHAVWEAITDPRAVGSVVSDRGRVQRARPLAPPIEFRFAEDRYPPMSGQVLEVVPSQRLAFTWGDDELTFELEEREDGTACRLALSVVLDSAEKAARDAAGWDQCLDALGLLVGGQRPERPMPSDRWQRLLRGVPAAGTAGDGPHPGDRGKSAPGGRYTL